MSPETSALVQLALRWVHFVAGITWIGLLYFFNLVNVDFMKQLDPALKGKVFPPLMTRALWWFRWSALLTVIAGVTYWMMILGSDVRAAHALAQSGSVSPAETAAFATASGGRAALTFFALWTAAWWVTYVAVCRIKINRPLVVGLVYVAAVSAAAYLFLRWNGHGWESSRLLSIGVGGGMGWMMFFNVWGVIWRLNKPLIRWTEAAAATGAPVPPQAASCARQSYLTSRANFVLSLPMLFFMAAASHYPLFS